MLHRGGRAVVGALALCTSAWPLAAGPQPNASAGAVVAGSAACNASALFPPPSTPSGEALPTADLPGWRHTFADDFTTNVALGDFPAAVTSSWRAYPSPWRDTSGFGTYRPQDVVAVANGVLDAHIRTIDGQPSVAALVPKAPGSDRFGQLYGRYAIRFRSDSIAGYKVAWLLWPDSNRRAEGEIDFPERNLDTGSVSGFVHHRSPNGASDQEQFTVDPFDGSAWHTAVIEWSPDLVVFELDGQEIGRTSERVPDTMMHWVIQTETELNWRSKPVASSEGHVQIDWVSVWAWDPFASAPPPELTGVQAGSDVAGVVTLGALVADPCHITAAKWYAAGREVASMSAGPPWLVAWDTAGIHNGLQRLFVKTRSPSGAWSTSRSVEVAIDN